MRYRTVYKTFILAGFISLFIPHGIKAQVNKQDSLILVDLYMATNYIWTGNWVNKTNWLTSNPVSTWFGVTVENNRVTGLRLSRNMVAFTNQFPPSMGNLDALKVLDLSGIQLIGALPDWMSNLKKLEYLNLEKTNSGGSIPAGFGQFANLTYLNLGLNYFNDVIPASLGNLSKLKTLILNYNDLDGEIPATFKNLTSLEWLDVGDNRLKGPIPQLFNSLSSLKHIDIQYNLFSGTIPLWITTMTSLEYLDLSNNLLTGTVPPELSNLVNLTGMLSLAGNQLTGTIPVELSKLKKLQKLYLGYNQLTGNIPPELGQLTSLQTLSLAGNQLTGTIPPTFINLVNIQDLILTYNQLHDSIPAWVSSFPHLQTLLLDRNFFTFAGMEQVAQNTQISSRYNLQGLIKVHAVCNGKLSVTAGGTPANNTYKWYNDNGVLMASLTGDSTYTPAPGPGTYYVVVTNAIATKLTLYSDSVYPSGFPIQYQNINTTICGGRSYTLPSGKTVSAAGVYKDTLRIARGCDSLITTVTLAVTPLKIVNTNATACNGAGYLLPWGQKVYLSGTYSDTIHTNAGCDSIINNITLYVDTLVVQKTQALALCNGRQAVINAGSPLNSYQWSTGETGNSITVSTPGVYRVAVNGPNGCSTIDTFNLTVRDIPVVKLNNNIVLCYGQPKTIDAGNGYVSYLWSNGSTGQTTQVLNEGSYSVTVTDSYGCKGSAAVTINNTVMPPSAFLPPDTVICTFTTIQVAALNAYKSYQWSTGETTRAATINGKAVYWLTVTDANGCYGTDTITVTQKECTVNLAVPTGFTPNGDLTNDVFKPVYTGSIHFNTYRMSIYNRYGQCFFVSKDPLKGWDGTVNGIASPPGVYVWVFEYSYGNTGPVVKKGTVTLVR